MIIVSKLTPAAWEQISENTHKYCFKEIRPADMDRISFALVAYFKDKPAGYVTCRELDAETLYWQYGGAFPTIEKSINTLKVYQALMDESFKQGFLRITTYIQNDNYPMLKLALHCGYKIIGVRNFKNEIFVELLKENN